VTKQSFDFALNLADCFAPLAMTLFNRTFLS